MSTKVDTYQEQSAGPDRSQETVEGGVGPLLLRPLLRRVPGAARPDHLRWLQQQPKKLAMIG
ncbi:hypothetical protein [Stenotrophomonas sp.]|uniref:hypothetical protein n=1 Tax=Stenotrophomonas sp. TaxID=69392 RepID=UPI0028A71996|nr:hypothetical protein [Stenotrophomonas sp.]